MYQRDGFRCDLSLQQVCPRDIYRKRIGGGRGKLFSRGYGDLAETDAARWIQEEALDGDRSAKERG